MPAQSDFHPEMGQGYPTAKVRQKFEGFDFLRAIFSLAIVAYKTNVFYIPTMLVASSFTTALSEYVVSGMFGALAVPTFLQMSLFLFYGKSQNTDLSYFLKKRLPRLVSLYLFWVIAITVFDILFVDGLEAVREATSSVKSLLLFIVSGNSTPYFFFFSLLFVTVLAEALVLLLNLLQRPFVKTATCYGFLIASCLLVFAFSTIEPIVTYTGIQSSPLSALNNLTGWDYTPTNFLPYIFTAIITAREYGEGKLETLNRPLKRKLYGLLGLAVAFFTLEWVLTSRQLLIQVDQAPLDHYMRLSLVFASWLLLYLALLSKRKVPEIIKFLSACSLGIYGFHVFFIFKHPLPLERLPGIGGLFQASPILHSLTVFSIALLGAIALTLLAKRIKPLRSFV